MAVKVIASRLTKLEAIPTNAELAGYISRSLSGQTLPPGDDRVRAWARKNCPAWIKRMSNAELIAYIKKGIDHADD